MLEFALALVASGVLATVLWVTTRAEPAQEPWIEAITKLGLRLRGERFEACIDGFVVQLQIARREGIEGPCATVQLLCRLAQPLDLGLSLRPRFGQQGDDSHGREELPSDGDFELRADEASRVERMARDEGLELAISALAWASEREFFVTDGGIHGELTEGLMEFERLRNLARAAIDLAQQLDRVRRKLPVAQPLAEHHRRWATFAAQRELELSTTPLALVGRVDGLRVRAYSERFAPRSYRLVVAVSFEQPLGLGRVITSAEAVAGDDPQALAQARFRRNFDERIVEVGAKKEFDDLSIQEALLALGARYLAVALDDGELRVTAASVPLDPEPLEALLHEVVAAGRLIEGRIHRSARRERGPYR